MTKATRQELIKVATRYIWWEKPNEAVRRPLRVIAQAMNIGDFDDVQRMLAILGEDSFREALTHAEPGWFNERSWHYWFYRLGLVAPGSRVPAMPKRIFNYPEPQA